MCRRWKAERSTYEDGRTVSDEHAFEDFVVARGSALLRTAVLLCAGSRHDAEDAVQTALEKAYRHWGRVEGDPEPYVRRILVNVIISRARRWKVLREVHMAHPPEPLASSAEDGVVLRDLLIRELHRLPPRQRAVLVLRYWEDLSELQIATLLGCSAGTVKSQASKALARLRNAGFVSAGVSNEH
jgi:RNA polymerase sigma-70 factor (sigma-E family)